MTSSRQHRDERDDRSAHAAGGELRVRALLAQSRTRIAGDIAMHDALSDWVREMRQEGTPPERVLVAVKHALHGADIHQRTTGYGHRLYDDAINWTIAAYYA